MDGLDRRSGYLGRRITLFMPSAAGWVSSGVKDERRVTTALGASLSTFQAQEPIVAPPSPYRSSPDSALRRKSVELIFRSAN